MTIIDKDVVGFSLPFTPTAAEEEGLAHYSHFEHWDGHAAVNNAGEEGHQYTADFSDLDFYVEGAKKQPTRRNMIINTANRMVMSVGREDDGSQAIEIEWQTPLHVEADDED